MKKIYFLLGIISLLFLSNIGYTETNQKDISYSTIFSSNKEFVNEDISSPNFVEYSTAVNISKKGTIINKQIYEGIHFSVKLPLQNNNIFLESGINNGLDITIGINKKDLSLIDYNSNSSVEPSVLDETHIYSVSYSENKSGIKKTNLISKKETLLKLDDFIDGIDGVDAIDSNGNSVFVICRVKEQYFLYEIDKNKFRVKNKILMEDSVKLDTSFLYNFFKLDGKIYIIKTSFIENTIEKKNILYYDKVDKKIKTVNMKKEDFGIKYNMKDEDKIALLESKHRHGGYRYYKLKDEKIFVLNEKSGQVKKYKIPKNLIKETHSPHSGDKFKGNSIYLIKEDISKIENIPKYEIIEYNFKDNKITGKTKLKNGTKNKKDYLELIDFSVN